jgi:glutamate dehydrogenase (NAD(P)+)
MNFEDIDEWGPEKVVIVSDRRVGMRGVLVIDNTARGTGKGGTRMSPTLTVTEVARLARTMTWKWAAVDLFHGGAKAGIQFDPLSPTKELALRAFARALSNEVPREYIFGLDIGVNEQDAAIFADELGDRGASTGLPHSLGGLPYDQLGTTGFGVAETTDAAAAEIGLSLPNLRVVVQGFGAVGAAAARRLQQLGATIVGVSSSEGSVLDPNGLDIARLLALRTEFGDACVRHYGDFGLPEAALEADTDVLIPAAREDTITVEVASATTARLIVEGANLPTSAASRAVLHDRGITVVPDFIANAGGIVAAAHSTAQRNSPFRLGVDGVFAMISERLRSNTAEILRRSARDGVSSHDAAVQMAQERVAEAMRARGMIERTIVRT